MFCGEISSVKKTRILVGKVYPCRLVDAEDKLGRARKFKQPFGNPLQLTVFSNQIGLARNPVDERGRSNTAMILPFPIVPDMKNRFKIFSMSEYGGIFDDVEMLFPDLPEAPTRSEDLALPVMNIGSYSVSVARDLGTLERVNPEKFNISQDILALAKQYYPKNFGFIVCILRTNALYHPLGYVHEIRKDGKLFVPTRHHHVQDTNSKYSMNQFSRYREWESGQNGEIDLGNMDDNAYSGSRYGDSHRTSVDLDNHFYDTIMQEDKFMRYTIKRTDVDQKARQDVSIEWDHQIYFVNHDPRLKSIQLPLPDRIANVYSYLSMNQMPKEITFGGIKSIVRLVLGPTTPGNRDLYL